MGVFLQYGEEFIEMHEAPYEAESILQHLLADYPGLLAGDGPSAEHRWLLVRREASVPAEEEGPGRWSVDHLFLDREGVPTIVEVKRSSDTRLRREVVGQMLDYAANATSYWRAERLRAQFDARCEEAGLIPDEVLAETLHVAEPDGFWAQVNTNLAASRLRLVFVGDVIPPELRRVVEYLNQEMSSTEVLAVEVKQYVESGGERRTLVSKTIGQTEAARQAKSAPRDRRAWDEAAILDDLETRRGSREVTIARRIISWAKQHQPPVAIQYGSGKTYSSMQFGLTGDGFRIFPFFLYSTGQVEIQFSLMISFPYHPFDSEDKRQELATRLQGIEGIDIEPSRLAARPTFDLLALAETPALDQFLSVIGWAFEEASTAARRRDEPLQQAQTEA
jgi:hypothetical protein